MSTNWASFRFKDSTIQIPAGGIIGRLATAALRIDDPRVSEAHALLSRRGRGLSLLALRRWFEVNGKRASEVTLQVGQLIRLAPGVTLSVEEVRLDDLGLAVLGGTRGPVELEGGVYSIVAGPGGVHLESGYSDSAVGRMWSTGTGWSCQLEGHKSVELRSGTVLDTAYGELQVSTLKAQQKLSTMDNPGLDPPLRIVIRHETVHIFRPNRPPLVLVGIPARMVTEVALMGAPVSWDVPASLIWRDMHRHLVRQNWDRNNRTLRKKLGSGGIRTDLLRADGRGNVELFLMQGDEVVDES